MGKSFLISILALMLLPLEVSGKGYKIEEDMMNDNKNIYFILESENKVRSSIGIEKSGFLMIRYKNGEPEILIYTPTYNTSKEVGVRWDKDKPNFSFWNRSEDGTAFFHRNLENFINEIKKKDFLTLAWTPYQQTQEALKFDLNSQNWKEEIEQSIQDGCKL